MPTGIRFRHTFLFPPVIDTQFFHILIQSALFHINCFGCFSIYYMRDGSVAYIASVMI